MKQFDENTAKADWQKIVVSETVNGVIGIVGFGAIGRALAKLFSGWDCAIIAYDPHIDEAAARALGVKPVGLEELFETADAVSLHLPYTRETHHLVGGKLLGLMKKEAVIVNTSRGNIIDEAALAAVLREGRICGAGLDVFAQEPLPVSSPLVGLPNLVLTPHVSSQTFESLWRIYQMTIDIAAEFKAGKNSQHILNPDYQKFRDKT
ncbi:MAG: hypothetical protein Pg6C_17310 [Treponemataceae bacterium]|nr:MAG: hypothetical protein Pg6C_17310 [Treponemataceae bacterium]